jgi:DNA-binding PadR family transcriptional regulator
MPRRITKQLLALLDVVTDDPTREWYGLELMAATGLSSGTLYPLLHRLVADGWLVRTQEKPSEKGGASRRLYRLTAVGATATSARAPSSSGQYVKRARTAVKPQVQPAA